MIRNEREYRISKSQAEKFELAVAELANEEAAIDVHPRLVQAQRDSLKNQLTELRQELAEYEDLRTGKPETLHVESFTDIPRALIKARIASGLTQKELAERLGVKEQQVQRYEASEYTTASLERLETISDALHMRIRGTVQLPTRRSSLREIFRRLQAVGIEKDFLFDRVIPSRLAAELEQGAKTMEGDSPAQFLFFLNRVYGWEIAEILSSGNLVVDDSAVGAARFKTPRRKNFARFVAYTAYAHSLATIVLRATERLPQTQVPEDPEVVRDQLLSLYGEVSFKSALRYVWRLGIPVLPLRDSGNFHGACWRIGGRNVLVIKQRTPFAARWLHDLLHELHHAASKPGDEERTVVEESPLFEVTEDEEEEEANDFASEIVLSGRAEELAHLCAKQAGGFIHRLKSVVPRVAEEAAVRVDALANYVAYRLSMEGQNWWGAASKLQIAEPDPWLAARDLLFENAQFSELDEIDRGLLSRALSEVST